VKQFLVAAIAALTLVVAAPALGADVTLTGGATLSGDGTAKLVADVSNAATTDDFSGVELQLPASLKLSDVTQLSAEFNVTDDDCGAGSPRFQVQIGGKNMFVYLGPAGTFTGCTKNTWLSTGNLVGTADACRVDTSQFTGGTQCSTWAAAVTLLGSQAIEKISVVVDASWNSPSQTNPAFTDKEQTVLLRNVKLNATTFLEPKTQGGGGGGGTTKPNPARTCSAERTRMGTPAFNELWGKNGNDANAFGKCVSAMARGLSAPAAAHASIMSASTSCKAKGLKGVKLGQCVAAHDNVAATKTEAQENRKNKKK
jgi:hypothetical protein